MRADLVQTNLTAGEISPLLMGRTDLQRYANGARKLRNFVVRPQGGATRRRGTVYVATTKGPCRIYKFQFSQSQAYILEIGDKYLRIFRNDVFLVELVTPYSYADVSGISFCQSADVLFLTHKGYQTRKLSRLSDTSWTFTLFETKDGPYLSSTPDGVSLTLSGILDTATLTTSVSGNFTAGVDEGKFIEFRYQEQWRLGKIRTVVASNQVTIDYYTNLVLGVSQSTLVTSKSVSAKYPKMSPSAALSVGSGVMSSDRSDTFTAQDVGKYVRSTAGGWYLITGFTGVVGSVQNVSVGTVLTLKTYSGVAVLSNRVINAKMQSTASTFASTDVGRQFRLNYFSAQTWGKITAFTGAFDVDVQLFEDVPLSTSDPTQLSNAGTTDSWKLGAWSDTTGWPSTMTFHEQRSTFARTNKEPQTLWMSKSSDYNNFAPSDLDSQVQDSSAITYTIASTEVSEIFWLSSGKTLLIGTSSGEWEAKSDSSIGNALSPTNIRVTEETYNGSRQGVRPIRTDTSVLHVQVAGRKVLEMSYDFSIDAFSSKNVTIVSDHILGPGAVDLAFQHQPYSVAWFVRSDGLLAGLTYEKEQEVYAWHLHTLGGTDSRVESVTVIPSPDATEDYLYMVVRRLIAGVEARFIERMGPSDVDQYLDASLDYEGPPITTVTTGLSHLEGQVVTVMSKGSVVGDFTVIGGSITFSSPKSSFQVGIHAASVFQTLPPEGGNPLGTAQGKLKRVVNASIRVHESVEFKHGPTEDNLDTFPFRDTADPMDQMVPLFTGVKTFPTNNDVDRENSMFIVQDRPYPLNILSFMPEVRVYERT